MNIVKSGSTRIVLVFKSTVWKIPRFNYSWEHFLKGLLANMTEGNTWKWNSGKYETGLSHLLCPVLFCSWGGWLIIMAKADVEKHILEIRNADYSECPNEVSVRYDKWISQGLGGDDKCDNYGYIGNILVKIDYAS